MKFSDLPEGEDGEEDSKMPTSHQGKFAPAVGEGVDCGLDAATDAGLLLLTSNGLGNDNLRHAFRQLVLELPDDAWAASGASRKAAARARDLSALANASWAEPDLYQGLDVLVLEDACFLKRSMWDESDPNFNNSHRGGINHATAGFTTDPGLFQPFFGASAPLDRGWCVDWAQKAWGGLGGLGFETARMRHLSLFDRLAPEDLKRTVLQLQTEGGPSTPEVRQVADPDSAAFAEASAALRSADIVVLNGGNPDFLDFVLTRFAKALGDVLSARARAGSLVLVGRSAGSMVAAADVGLTYEPSLPLLEQLLQRSTTGMALAGSCSIRPHYGEKWQLAAMVYGKLRSLNVVLMPNSEGLRCLRTECRMAGRTSAQGTRLALSLPHNLGRLAEAFAMKGPPQ
mmetsp:Transcript_51326/g.164332  ORF Transcript_51326/g.164332 Transcript_51326/m.164332 type:complete len:400 (+) Transcript_51326:1154-2353(+)